MTSNREWLHAASLEEIYAWMDAEHEPSGDGARSFAGKCDALRDDLMALQTEAIAELQSEIAKRDKGIERLKKRRDELELRVNSLVAELGDTEGENLVLRRERDEARAQLDRKPTDAVREFAERYEQRIGELEAIVRDLFFELDWLRIGLTTLDMRRRQINDVCERARSLVEVDE